jgi:hypothetical protein
MLNALAESTVRQSLAAKFDCVLSAVKHDAASAARQAPNRIAVAHVYRIKRVNAVYRMALKLFTSDNVEKTGQNDRFRHYFVTLFVTVA